MLEGEVDFGALPARVTPLVRRTIELCLEKDARNPTLLPGGHAVLFHVFGGGENHLVVLDLRTGEERVLLEDVGGEIYSDTGHVLFVRAGTLFAVPFDAAALAVTGEPVALVDGIRHPVDGAADYALSASGTLVYVPADDNTTPAGTLVWVERSGEAVAALTEPLIGLRDPRVSTDGTRVALVTGFQGDGDLWSYDLSGRPPIPLAVANDAGFPVWSPDGSQVAIALGPNSPVFAVSSKGSARPPETLGGRGMPHAWSAAGELIFVWPLGAPDILAAAASSLDDSRAIVASEYSEFDPALSPDGRWLAYVSDQTGQNEIWVQAYPDGAPVRVSSAGGYEPLWSADGRELFYRRADAVMAVGVMADAQISFGTPQQLFSGAYTDTSSPNVRGYDIGPDGRFLMILPSDETPVGQGSIVVVQNFAEELRSRVRPAAQ